MNAQYIWTIFALLLSLACGKVSETNTPAKQNGTETEATAAPEESPASAQSADRGQEEAEEAVTPKSGESPSAAAASQDEAAREEEKTDEPTETASSQGSSENKNEEKPDSDEDLNPKAPLPTNASAPEREPVPQGGPAGGPAQNVAPPEHDRFDALLRQHVDVSGGVDYRGFKQDKEKLQAYLDLLNGNPPHNTWSENERLAYWINAYNAHTINLVVENLPVSRIINIENAFKQKIVRVDGTKYSLDEVENQIIRQRFDEPRIHFALVCAAVSCPPLLNRAFDSDRLDQQLESRAQNFINNTRFNSLSSDRVELSKIFDWYGEDFRKNGSLIDYLNRYAEEQIDSDAEVVFNEYDWSLNKQ